MKDTLNKLAVATTTSAAMFLSSAGQASAQIVQTCPDGSTIFPIAGQKCPDLIPAGFFQSFSGLITKALTFVLAIGVLLVFLYLIWGGIDWITSGGDKGKTESARNKITAAIIGLIVMAAAYAILTLALGFLGVTLTGVFDQAGVSL